MSGIGLTSVPEKYSAVRFQSSSGWLECITSSSRSYKIKRDGDASDYKSCDLTIDGEPWIAVAWRITPGCFSAIKEFQRAESQL